MYCCIVRAAKKYDSYGFEIEGWGDDVLVQAANLQTKSEQVLSTMHEVSKSEQVLATMHEVSKSEQVLVTMHEVSTHSSCYYFSIIFLLLSIMFPTLSYQSMKFYLKQDMSISAFKNWRFVCI